MTFEARSGQNMVVNSNQFTNTFQNETVKKQERMCEVDFLVINSWLSIFIYWGCLRTYSLYTYFLLCFTRIENTKER